MSVRELFVRAPRAQRVDLSDRHIVITGATPGSIGFETARILASWGASVAVTTRSDPEAAVQALRARIASVPGHGEVFAHALDLCDFGSIKVFADWYRDTLGARLDVLVNNAGIHLDLLSQWKSPRLTADGHEIHWRTNYLGTMQLTLALLPLLQRTGLATGDARVVNVVSQLHAKGRNDALFAPLARYDSWTAYGTSKLALVHATTELQRRYANSHHLQAYCLHPGAVFTRIADKGLAGNPLLEALRRRFAPIEAFFLLTPEEGAQTSVHCATSPDASGGRYYRSCAPAQPSAASEDRAVAARLWQQTMDWIDTQDGTSP